MNAAADIADAALARPPRPGNVAALLGISGIDASGKSTLAREVASVLSERGVPHVLLSVDWFHTPADVRFQPGALPAHAAAASDPGEHFYRHAFRWDDLFDTLIDPLLASGSCDAEVGIHDMPTDRITPRRIVHTGVRVVVLEGIFIFRSEAVNRFDLRVWIDCPFETALRRALARNQEGGTPDSLRADYQRVYFPAQRHHIERDRPAERCDVILRPSEDA